MENFFVKELKVKMEWLNGGMSANMALCLGLVQASAKELTNTDVANALRLSFPTAQKCLRELVARNYICETATGYRKI